MISLVLSLCVEMKQHCIVFPRCNLNTTNTIVYFNFRKVNMDAASYPSVD